MSVPQPLYCFSRPLRQTAVATALFGLLFGFHGITSANELRIGGTGAALGTMQLLGEVFGARHPDIRIKIVPNLGSAGGIQAAAGGAIDLAVTSRPLKQDELKLGTSELEYGRTPFVFAVNMKSRITETTLAQLAASFPLGNQVGVVSASIGIAIYPDDADSAKELLKRADQAMYTAKSQGRNRCNYFATAREWPKSGLGC